LVHRTPALNPRAESGPYRPSDVIKIVIALAVLEAFWLGWFLLEPLPNAGNVGGNGLRRWDIVSRALPQVMVAGLTYRESHLGKALRDLSHFENLPQRVPILLAAAFIAASAVSAGNLALRGLRLRKRLDRWERLAAGFGLGTTALGLATLVVGRLGLLQPWTIRVGLAVPIVAELACLIGSRGPKVAVEAKPGGWSLASKVGFGLVAGPFLLVMMLGAMLPTIDFDSLEYHIQGPKEYYQAGRIAFLDHNVYTSMPFGTEMLHLLGMELVDHWWFGALVGQLIIALFAPASAAMIALTARRIGSNRAAWVAAVAYLTTPWIYRMAALPYVEGPLCYFHAALLWAVFKARDADEGHRLGALVGLLAGGAMATKYPALISAVIPFSGWAAWASWRAKNWRIAVAYAAGVALVVAPWLIRNVIDTGNPVYPLGYKVFGGRHWDPARDAQWSAVHGPKPIKLGAFAESVVDVAGRSDWQSPLFAALAPLALLRPGSRRSAGWLVGYSAYLFLTWWLLTHRLDRFWLPMLPPMAILAGLGADWVRSRAWVVLLWVVMGISVATNAAYCSTALAGVTHWTSDLDWLRIMTPRSINPPLARLDATLPPGAKPLLVGQAGVFHLNRPIVYNTVFDDEAIETIARGRTPDQVLDELRRLGVTHIYVDWTEIERYRSPGNYGFTPFVTPELFARLVEAGVLGPPSRMGPRQDLFEVGPSRTLPR
jgi:4-amino-4-deoxy-L-arabinose transferase-like glycosyltransferase